MAGKTVADAISAYGASAKAKLANIAISGAPEDQLRGPLEALVHDLARLGGVPAGSVQLVGETTLSDIKTRPDFAVTVSKALVGFIEVKAPGKGADPRQFNDPHDKEQWDKLKSLPNLIYTDGNAFSLWRDGKLEGAIVHLDGNVEIIGRQACSARDPAAAHQRFSSLDADSAEERKAARASQRPPLPAVARRSHRADGARQPRAHRPRARLAQAALSAGGRCTVRRRLRAGGNVRPSGRAGAGYFACRAAPKMAAQELRKSNSLIGTALRLLTEDSSNQEALKTSLGTLTRVLDAVNWHTISKDKPEAWLYFYEDFLEVYDNTLRKRTGSYYTPPEVVSRDGQPGRRGPARPAVRAAGWLRRRRRDRRRPGGRHRHVPARCAAPHCCRR